MLSETLMPGLVAGAFGIALIILVTSTFFTVQQRTAAMVQRFGTLVGSGRSSRTSIRIPK